MMVSEEDIRSIIGQVESLKEKAYSIDGNKDFASQGIDSLDMLSVYLMIQERYNVEIPDEDIPKLDSIKSIVEYLNSRLNG